MIAKLAKLIEKFPGLANQTRCFLHTLNLVARSILHQFDVPNSQVGQTLDEAERELSKLARDLDIEEVLMEPDQTSDEEADDKEGLIDVRTNMSGVEQMQLDASVRPVKFVLVKVCNYTSEKKPCPLNRCAAPKTGLCNEELHDHYPTWMVQDPWKIRAEH
jgi:hypothetical protein